MKIVFITNNFTPYSAGVVSSIKATISALQKYGHKVTVITLDFDGKQHDDLPYVHRLICPIKFYHRQNPIGLPWRALQQIDKIMQVELPDVVHSHHPFGLGWHAQKIAHMYNVPIVFTHHTMYEDFSHYVPFYQPLVKQITNSLVIKYCNDVDHIIAPSSAVKNMLQSKKIITPVTCLPSPIIKLFEDQEQQVQVPYKKGPFKLIAVSRFVPEKNLHALLDLMKLLPRNVTLILVGYGILYTKLKSYAFDELHLETDRVTFLYKPEKPLLQKAYQAAHCFLFTSKTDTQGLVLAESMSCSTPVIALDGPGQRDIVVDGVNGFIVDDLTQMAKVIKKLMHSPKLYKELQEGAYATSRKYTTFAIGHQLNELYLGL
jgi:glycosyltransferase involved in cell wall biosynthesis